jgi:hypothetical protein
MFRTLLAKFEPAFTAISTAVLVAPLLVGSAMFVATSI